MKTTWIPVLPKSIFLSGLFSFLLLLVSFGQAQGATVELCPLLPSGGTVTLNPSNTYHITNQCWLSKSVTINGNGATITGIGPLGSTVAGVTVTLDHVIFTSSGWAALATLNGSHIIVQNNSSISCPGGTGVDAETGSNITVQNSSISSSNWGVQIKTLSTANLHGVTITGTPYAVQADGIGASVTIDGNSLLDYQVSATTGVGILNGASGVVHDTTIRGFLNGVDVRPTINGSTVSGTVDIQNCLFDTNGCSGLSAVYAHDVNFSTSTVNNAQQDGIYFYHSTGVIDKSQVIGSLNSGVSFEACPDGATIQNSLVKNNAHQGINVVECEIFPCPAPVTPSLNIKVLNNTLVNNHLANILISQNASAAQTPPALIQGNIFTQSPQASIRFWGPQGITLDSALVTGSVGPSPGVEIKMGSNPEMVLSAIAANNTNGILVYDNNSSLTAEHSFFWNNGLTAAGGSSGAYSIFVDLGTTARVHNSTLGTSGTWGLYNNSTASCDVTSNYWSAVDGPYADSWILPSGVANGSGAHLGASTTFHGPVTYIPFLTQAPVGSNINLNASLPAGGSLPWDSGLGLTIGLTANQGSTALSNEILGVLKVNDTGSLNLVTPPDYMIQGQLYAVWISAPLRFNSASGSLQFSLPSQNRAVALMRWEIDGSWTPVSSTWNQSSHMLTYSPTDVHLLNGTFAIVDAPDIFYAKCDGSCSGKTPCFPSILSGISSIQTNTVMNATQETFAGNVTYNFPAVLTLSGGWDSTYANPSSFTVIQGTLTIETGQLIVENIVVE